MIKDLGKALRTLTLVYVAVATVPGSSLPGNTLINGAIPAEACVYCLFQDDGTSVCSDHGESAGGFCWTDSNGFCYTAPPCIQ